MAHVEHTTASVEREMELVRSAIAMVASNGSRRVIVAGIRFGDVLLAPGQRLALESGVRLRRLPHDGDDGIDLAVESIQA